MPPSFRSSLLLLPRACVRRPRVFALKPQLLKKQPIALINTLNSQVQEHPFLNIFTIARCAGPPMSTSWFEVHRGSYMDSSKYDFFATSGCVRGKQREPLHPTPHLFSVSISTPSLKSSTDLLPLPSSPPPASPPLLSYALPPPLLTS